MKLKLVEAFASANHGLVTAAAREAGMSKSTWNRAIASEQLVPGHRGVARIVGAIETPHQRIAAAVLAAGRDALASHRAAAYLWDIPLPSVPRPEITLPQRGRQATLEGVIVHRPRDLLDLGAVYKHGIPTCKLLRLACDYGAVDPAGAHAVIGHMVTNGWASPVAFDAAVRMHSRRGRPGVSTLRAVLADWLADGMALDSELERRMTRLVKRFGLPAVEFHPVILGYEVDFRVVGMPVVIECDGWEWHDKRRLKFERDRKQDIELTAAGYVTVRFTWTMITRQPQWVAAKIREAVARWSSDRRTTTWAASGPASGPIAAQVVT